MFQNGLLATFIPEIIMVLAYAFCLLGPTKSVESSNSAHLVLKVAESHTGSSTSVYYLDQQDFIQAAELIQQEGIVSSLTEFDAFKEYKFYRLSGCLSFVQFSRPPPSFRS